MAGGSNLYPTGSFKRHDGNDYWMVYAAADIPSGVHHVGRLANLGTNHWALDGGGAYTNFDPGKGHDFPIVGGLTYNFENHDTDNRSGVDSAAGPGQLNPP